MPASPDFRWNVSIESLGVGVDVGMGVCMGGCNGENTVNSFVTQTPHRSPRCSYVETGNKRVGDALLESRGG